MKPSIPNLLSWSRIVLAVPVVVLYLAGGVAALVALVLYIIAAVTDYADGRIARSTGGSNAFGTFLDPVADKVLVVCVLLALVAAPEPAFNRFVLAALAAAVIIRELAQSALRDWMAQLGKSAEVGVTLMSKTKTSLQMVALGVLIGHGALEVVWPGAPSAFAALLSWGGTALLFVAATLGFVTMWRSMRVAFGPARGAGESQG